MTLTSGALDKSLFDERTILLKTRKEYGRYSYVYNGGDMICSFLTIDNICKYISNMGKNLTPYSIAIGEENIFLTPDFKSIKRGRLLVMNC